MEILNCNKCNKEVLENESVRLTFEEFNIIEQCLKSQIIRFEHDLKRGKFENDELSEFAIGYIGEMKEVLEKVKKSADRKWKSDCEKKRLKENQ